MSFVPYVVEQSAHGERSYDIFSRLLNDRIIVLSEDVNDTTASLVVAQLLYLEGQDPIRTSACISTAPAAPSVPVWPFMTPCSISSAMFPPSAWAWLPLWAHSCWQAAPRVSALPCPNAEIMIHQPLIGGQGGGLSGQTTDIKIHAEHMVYIRDKMNRMLSEYTGQPLEKIQQDTERDNYLTAQQAKEYGLIDEVIAHR